VDGFRCIGDSRQEEKKKEELRCSSGTRKMDQGEPGGTGPGEGHGALKITNNGKEESFSKKSACCLPNTLKRIHE